VSPASRLDAIVAQTREDLVRRKRELPLDDLRRRAAEERARAPVRPGLREALSQPPIGVIAEFKRRSPSAGALAQGADVSEVVRAYERGGASALSILTEGPNFAGSLADLSSARAASQLPILRKDFVVDAYQLHEALLAGADAVLLIVAALARSDLAELHAEANELGLETLIEVHDHEELGTALDIGAPLVGINNRDLRDFTVDLARSSQLAKEVPSGVTLVSESGIARPDQLLALARDGVHAVLVGESLMRAPDPAAALAALLCDAGVSTGASKI
jgi:indole-3-glycerol phosphate synthase